MSTDDPEFGEEQEQRHGLSAVELVLSKAREVAGDPTRFTVYANNPIGFAEDCLGVRSNPDLGIYGLWGKQRDILLACVDRSEERLGSVTRVRLLRERVSGAGPGAEFSWEADRGLALTGPEGTEALLLSVPEPSEQVLFLPTSGLYRTLLDPGAPAVPGATVRELLGYGEWSGHPEIAVDLIPL